MEINNILQKAWPEWKVVGKLGEGAYGKVYHIRREEYGHVLEAALKLITVPADQAEIKMVMAEVTDYDSASEYFESIVKEFANEFVLMEELMGNTNIVSYEDHKVIAHEDNPGWDILIRMELLTPFSDYMVDHEIDEKMTADLGIDICDALILCHSKHIIHRDIKPQNIFITNEGKFKLGDFGVARTAERTMSAMSKKGTYTYMAPEVYKGEAYSITADIYSLGLLLYRLLNDNREPFMPPVTEKITFSVKDQALQKRMSGMEIPRPRAGSRELQDVVLKACSFYRQDRYQSSGDMKKDLLSVREKLLEQADILNQANILNQGPVIAEEQTYNIFDVKGEDLIPETESGSRDQDSFENTISMANPNNETELTERVFTGVQSVADSNSIESNNSRDDQFVEKQDETITQEKESKGQKSLGRVPIVISIVLLLSVVAFFGLGLFNNGKVIDEKATSINNKSKDEVGKSTDSTVTTETAKTTEVKDNQNQKNDEMVDVPYVIGKKEKDAKAIIQQQGLLCKITRVWSSTEKKGIVIDQDAKEYVSAGSKKKKGDTIEILISRGKKYGKETSYLGDYVRPKTLAEDPKEPEVLIDGYIYRLPCPFTEFEINGWEIADYSDIEKYSAVAPSTERKDGNLLDISKGDKTISLTIKNYSEKEVPVIETAVSSIDIHAYDLGKVTDNEIMFPGYMSFNYGKNDLEELIHLGFNTEYHNAHYYEEDKEGNFTLYINYDYDKKNGNSVRIDTYKW